MVRLDDSQANFKRFIVNAHHLRRDGGLNVVGTTDGRVGKLSLQSYDDRGEKIVAYVEKLNGVDTEGVEPLASVFEVSDMLRDDEPGPMLSPAEALRNAPKKTEGFFSVPKVLGDSVE